MSGFFDETVAPAGAGAPSLDFDVIAAPSVDTPLTVPARAFEVQAAGVVSVVTAYGETRTFTAREGQYIACGITEIKAATAVDLLVYLR